MSQKTVDEIKQQAYEFSETNQWSELDELLQEHIASLASEPDYYLLWARLQLHASQLDAAQQWLERGLERFSADIALNREFVVLVEVKRHMSLGLGKE